MHPDGEFGVTLAVRDTQFGRHDGGGGEYPGEIRECLQGGIFGLSLGNEFGGLVVETQDVGLVPSLMGVGAAPWTTAVAWRNGRCAGCWVSGTGRNQEVRCRTVPATVPGD